MDADILHFSGSASCAVALPFPHAAAIEWRTIFRYDPEILAAVRATPQTIADVVGNHADHRRAVRERRRAEMVQQAVPAGDAGCGGAGERNANGFMNPAWMATLDVKGFAGYYFRAIESSLSGQPTPGCWQ